MLDSAPIHLHVEPADAGRPLVAIVERAVDDHADAALLIARGGLWVEKARVIDGSLPAEVGAHVTIHTPPGGTYHDVVFDPAWIVFEDADLLALNKPAGVYTGMTPWDVEGNIQAALDCFLTERDGTPPQLHAAHRLDRNTSGVLLFSKNPAVNSKLQRAFAEHQARKTYLCLCAGQPEADEWTVETGHGRTINGHFHAYPREHVGQMLLHGSVVKHMITRFVVVERHDDGTLLHAFPQTGRTHQIRLHAAYAGHPLVGDAKYGGPTTWRNMPVFHHHLHAARLQLPHPRTNEPLTIEAPLPEWACTADY
jgi:23S rRNA pseudouridine1911/1915/1917 synthase